MADPQVLSRAQCGLARPNLARLSPRGTQPLWGITTHITDTSSANPVGTWRTIQAEYMSGNNVNHEVYGDLPYNVGITMAGQILEGRADAWVGAHAKSANNVLNRQTSGVVFIGRPGELTEAAKQAYRAVVLFGAAKWGHPLLCICHSDGVQFGGPATGCPDEPIRSFVRTIGHGR